MTFDPQSDLYDRFVRRGELCDEFSAKRLYPGLSSPEAAARIRRLRDAERSCDAEIFTWNSQGKPGA